MFREKILSYQVTSEDVLSCNGGRIDLLLKSRLGLSPREIRHAKFTPEGILLGSREKEESEFTFRRVGVKSFAKPGSMLRVTLTAPAPDKLARCPGKLNVLYEDEDIIAVDKPAGIVSHPAHGHYCDTMANLLASYLSSRGAPAVIRLIGRLDQDTSGVLLFAKSRAAALRLARQRERGMLRKTYLAVVKWEDGQGISVSDRETVIDLPLGPVPGELMKQQIMEPPSGKPALTKYRVLETGEGCALVEVKPQTGRTHQIRVHLAAAGHPLLGDSLYADAYPEIRDGAKRTLLHAWRLELLQPFGGEPLQITAPVPEDFCFGKSPDRSADR